MHVARRLASLKVEEEMESFIPTGDVPDADTEALHYMIRMSDGTFQKKERAWIGRGS